MVWLLKTVGRSVYHVSLPFWRLAVRTTWSRRLVEALLRLVGRLIVWAFNGKPKVTTKQMTTEWQRILLGLGLSPKIGSQPTQLCFDRCSLGLRKGESDICNMVMTVNEQIISQLGGNMKIHQRLTDHGCSQCKVDICPKPTT